MPIIVRSTITSVVRTLRRTVRRTVTAAPLGRKAAHARASIGGAPRLETQQLELDKGALLPTLEHEFEYIESVNATEEAIEAAAIAMEQAAEGSVADGGSSSDPTNGTHTFLARHGLCQSCPSDAVISPRNAKKKRTWWLGTETTCYSGTFCCAARVRVTSTRTKRVTKVVRSTKVVTYRPVSFVLYLLLDL